MVFKKPLIDELSKERLFEEIYRKHFKKVLYFAFRYLDDYGKAENIAQDVFLTLWGQIEDVNDNGEVLPLLFVLTKFRCLNWLRREKHHQQYVKSRLTDLDISITALMDDGLTNLYNSEFDKHLKKAIEIMPDKVRDTFIYSRFKNLKNKEIAELQNISEKTVEYRISCSFKVLRNYFKNYLEAFVGILYVLWN
jgi:RNA polymerase sigma-70 factor (ECF subfamily)